MVLLAHAVLTLFVTLTRQEVKMRTVREIMTTSTQAIHRDESIREAERVFVTQNISGVPIRDFEGNLVGFVSKTDIIRFDSSGEDSAYTKLHEIATPKVVTIDASVPIYEAAQKMLQECVHHLVVMDGESMVGVLSAFDFVRNAAEMLVEDQEEDITASLC